MLISFLQKIFKKRPPANPLWTNLVIGRIVTTEKHPNADRLKVCTVDCGSEMRTIVCGGVNVREGMLTAVAVPGVKVYISGGNDLLEIKPTTIRGVASDGMLCGPDEIQLNDRFPKKADKEIIDLSALPQAAPGMTLTQALH